MPGDDVLASLLQDRINFLEYVLGQKGLPLADRDEAKQDLAEAKDILAKVAG